MTELEAIKDLEVSCRCLRKAIESEIFKNGYELKPRLEVFELSVNALNKQIPKKISRESVEESYRCPLCNNERSWKDGIYCKDCGQRLEW